MNFFEHQERARRRTWLLGLYFVLATAAVVLATCLVLFFFLWCAEAGELALGAWLRSPAFVQAAGLTCLIILGGSLRKVWQLRDGGEALAAMLGAREIPPDTRMTDERLLRNVVEEMAIASGIPAPRTFLLPRETSINAFVAGHRPTEAVVVVTQGLLDHLRRDELQGVIAHEFSHIFNADMRLNMRLLAVLAGIVAIGKVGGFLLHQNFRTRRGGSGRSEVAGHIGAVLLGLALMALGYIGLFFGRLVRAAISRQRELLADASAVQFTRNPAGLAGALIAIRNGPGSQLLSMHAEDMSHMCFGDTLALRMRSLLATHPPLDERLRALGGEWVARARVRARRADATATPAAAVPGVAFAGARPVPAPAPPERVSEVAGTLDEGRLGYAVALHEAIPPELKARLRNPRGARLTVLALAASVSGSDALELAALLRLDRVESRELPGLTALVASLGSRMRLPLADLALPALKRLGPADRDDFRRALQALVRHDRRLTLFEFMLARLVDEHLSPRAGRAIPVRHRRYGQVAAEIQLLFSLTVHASGATGDGAREAFRRATRVLLPGGRTLLPRERCSLAALDRALDSLRGLSPLLKGPLVDGLADLALTDGKVQVGELELIRTVGEVLDVPVPPLPAVVVGRSR